MAVSKVDICNQALGHLRAEPIQSFTEASKNGVHCRTWYETSLKEVLSHHYWNFAKRRQALAYHGDDAPADGSWAYRYQVPANMINPIRIVNPLGESYDLIPFDLELSDDATTMSILTDERSATLEYVFFQENVSLYPPAFVYALTKCLSKNLAMPITEKPEIARKEQQDFYVAVGEAGRVNANSGVQRPERDAHVIRARD